MNAGSAIAGSASGSGWSELGGDVGNAARVRGGLGGEQEIEINQVRRESDGTTGRRTSGTGRHARGRATGKAREQEHARRQASNASKGQEGRQGSRATAARDTRARRQ